MAVYAVVMAGGTGTRLWPVSRSDNPKQLIKLMGGQSLFQVTLERLEPIFKPENTLVVAGPGLVPKLRGQAPDVPSRNFIVEPVGRGTAPCIGLAAVHVLKRDPGGVMAVLPADHYVSDVDGFNEVMRASCLVAEEGHLVTLGISAAYPSTGYGYIKQGARLCEVGGVTVYRVERFVEKPGERAAADMLVEGGYAWNSGMFVWRADRIMEEFMKHMPSLYSSLACILRGVGTPSYESILREAWHTVSAETIDYGVMEKADDVVTIPSDIGWSDIGSWSSLKKHLEEDEDQNALRGDAVLMQTSGSMVYGGKRLIATIGLNDMLIVDTEDALLVCRLKDDQKIKDLVNKLKNEKRSEFLV